jgi:NTE family protein
MRLLGRAPKDRAFEQTALVLQGGGALGSYQGGVCEGLAEAGIEPDWVAGISIGALNAAVIAGNPPQDRMAQLRRFWETICQPMVPVPALDWLQGQVLQLAPHTRRWFSGLEAWRAVIEGQKAFFSPRGPWPWLGGDQGPELASFYDTSALKGTLEALVDFDRLNHGPMRVSVGAVNVRTGNLEYFDNRKGAYAGRLRPEHFMASGALPPAFAAVEIEGEHYWDGGLVSNTPLSYVFDDLPRRDTLAFQVDLWSAKGRLPRNVYEAQERMKDIQYSSRTRAVTAMQAEDKRLRQVLQQLLDELPADGPHRQKIAEAARSLACDRHFSVIHLIYQEKAWEGMSKDYEFSTRTMNEHWQGGLDDIHRALTHDAWFHPESDGRAFIDHDHHRQQAV